MIYNCTNHQINIIQSYCVDFSNPRTLTLKEGCIPSFIEVLPPCGVILNCTSRVVTTLEGKSLPSYAVKSKFLNIESPHLVEGLKPEDTIIVSALYCSTILEQWDLTKIPCYIAIIYGLVVTSLNDRTPVGCLGLDYKHLKG